MLLAFWRQLISQQRKYTVPPVVFSVKSKGNILETEVIFLVSYLQGGVLVSIGSTGFCLQMYIVSRGLENRAFNSL